MQSMKPQLIVVYAKKNRKNGNYLAMRLSEIGYPTTEWTDEQYLQNMPTLKSTQKIIFFEDSKAVFCSNFTFDFEKFGMRYGWRANHCVVDVNQKEVRFEDKEKISEFLLTNNIDIQIDDEKSKSKFSSGWGKLKEKGNNLKNGIISPDSIINEMTNKVSTETKTIIGSVAISAVSIPAGGVILGISKKNKSDLIKVLDKVTIEIFLKYGIDEFIGE